MLHLFLFRDSNPQGSPAGLPVLMAGVLSLPAVGLLMTSAGCSREFPDGAIVMVQTLESARPADEAETILDQRYPGGSRLVLVSPPFQPANVQVLSKGLMAAGGPVVCPSGRRIFFAGKKTGSSPWQIYAATPGGIRPVTAMPGGAMHPAVLSEQDVIFSSPVPKLRPVGPSNGLPALYAQTGREPPRRLTFGTAAASEPEVLRDGRILFVAARAGAESGARSDVAKFTMNRDGTEVTAFTPDVVDVVQRAPELSRGRIDFPAHPGWRVVEAIPVTARPRPAGHSSSIAPGKKSGTILCLNANWTRHSKPNNASQAERVRVLAGDAFEPAQVLGEVKLLADGSFMVEVPADTPIGFETLDAEGRVLSRLPPAIWVRPGENRSCLGCHEPGNRSPRNARPLAATLPPARFSNVLQMTSAK